LGHRCLALFGLGQLEEGLKVVTDYVRIAPSGLFQLMTRCVFLQALGREAEAQDAVRKARKAVPSEGLDYWIGIVRGSYMSEAMLQSFSQHFTDAWNATPEDVS
jgi:hypothetical protein